MSNCCQSIILELSRKKTLNETDLFSVIHQQISQFKCPPPDKSRLLSAYHKLLKNKKIKADEKLEKLLKRRTIRTLSGVAVVSLLTKPDQCPGKCLYCPTEKKMPKSYLANEPAVMRAILNDFDPYRQIKMRLQALQANGHDTAKIELIIMGGTWSHHSPQYQNWFIKRCFEALNGKKTKNLASAQKQNETACHRCIGLTLETRPDYINEKEILKLRRFGCTRVELGIQQIDDRILKLNQRGHTAQASIRAIKLLKNAGFKINFHLMLNLPGATPAKDFQMFQKLYRRPEWLPDMIKIYPCVVTKNSALYKLWRQKKYCPYTDEQLLKLLIKIKKITPPFVRIARLIRDIPAESIVAGNKITNLRQLIADLSKKQGWHCQCIRCREAGHQNNSKFLISNFQNKIKLIIRKYQANGGTEYFLSSESADEKILYAFLRLRINDHPEKNFIPELKNSALVRELHTYGEVAGLGEKGEVQHLGLGKKLMAEAEKICRKNKVEKLAVIAGIGVRKYYEKLGYGLIGTYMVKYLKNK